MAAWVSAAPVPAGAADEPTMTTVVGTPGEGFALAVGQYPYGVTLHGNELLVADAANNVVRAIDLSDGDERVVAGHGGQALVPDDVEEGVPATTSALSGPEDVAFDSAGNLYIADTFGNRVRRVTTDGVIQTYAGNGGQTFSGDGGQAVDAGMYGPAAVAVDATGTLYVADSYNSRIRRVTPDGIISTIAGTGVEGDTGDGGPATAATLRQPSGLLLEPGALVIADTGNNRIRRLTFATGVISPVAGTGDAGHSGDGGLATAAMLNEPGGLAAHPSGGYVVADTLNHRIRRISAGGIISTIAGNGVREYGADGVAATATNLFAPEDVAVAADGTVFVADTRASRVRAIDPGSGLILAVAGTYYPHWNGDGAGTSTQISQVRGVAVADNGDVYFSDSFTHLIRKLRAADGMVERIAGTGNPGDEGDGGPAANASVFGPMGLAFLPDGDLVFADDAANKVRRIDLSGGGISTVAGTGTDGFSGDGGPATAAELWGPQDVAVAPDGDILVSDGNNHRVRRVDSATGVISTVAGNGSHNAAADDGGSALAAALPYPGGVDVGGDGTLFVAQRGGGRVRRISPSGTITTYLEGLDAPHGIALDGAGNLYVADSFAYRIRRVAPHGAMDVVAGNGKNGFAGDGLSPLAGRLNFPIDVAVTPSGDAIYIADFLNSRVRRAGVLPPTPPPPPPPPPPPVEPVPEVVPTAPPPTPGPLFAAPAAARSGYAMVTRDGSVHAFGDVRHLGDAVTTEAVDLEPTPSGNGYWIVDRRGAVYSFGDAAYAGGSPALAAGEHVTSMSAARSGYWLFTTFGRVIGYGGAPHVGDMAGTRLNGPVLDSVPTPSGRGYYLVASDGGIFTFGDAAFRGSMGSTPLNAPVQSLVPDPDGDGYWLVASDGGIFSFAAAFYGSMGSTRLNRPVTGMVGGPGGYLMVAEDGGIFTFGDVRFHGSLGASPPSAPVVAVAMARG